MAGGRALVGQDGRAVAALHGRAATYGRHQDFGHVARLGCIPFGCVLEDPQCKVARGGGDDDGRSTWLAKVLVSTQP